jgi:hypothetical protein
VQPGDDSPHAPGKEYAVKIDPQDPSNLVFAGD